MCRPLHTMVGDSWRTHSAWHRRQTLSSSISLREPAVGGAALAEFRKRRQAVWDGRYPRTETDRGASDSVAHCRPASALAGRTEPLMVYRMVVWLFWLHVLNCVSWRVGLCIVCLSRPYAQAADWLIVVQAWWPTWRERDRGFYSVSRPSQPLYSLEHV